MRPFHRMTLIAGLIILGVIVSRHTGSFLPIEPDRPTPASPIVATIGSRSISLQDIEQASALSLYQVDLQRHQLLAQALQRTIDEVLLENEAARKHVTVSKLLAEASQNESIAKMADLPGPVKRLQAGRESAESDVGSAEDLLEEARIRQALLVSLRRRADIRISLQAPESPTIPVRSDDAPSIGPDDAPITIVEFSDFQCSYCQKSVSTLQELRRLYGARIRLVYRDYPGPNHPYAQEAAEAAQCAGEQGKFWDYHDLLFEQQSPGNSWNFDALAYTLRLDQEVFSACMHTARYRPHVLKDLQDGIALGITSTPTFFINGRPLIGARSIAEFQTIIDRLLEPKAIS